MNSQQLFSIKNQLGMSMHVIPLGGKITSLNVPDRKGQFADIVLGYDTPEEYIHGHPYFGSIIGRVANRIANARFVLEGKEFRLSPNLGKHLLHGGAQGFNNRIWDIKKSVDARGEMLNLQYTSPDGEEGFPGNLMVKATYHLLASENTLAIEYEATTDQTTMVNLSHHSFFNLAGEGSGDIYDHELYINADTYTPVNEDIIPTGTLEVLKDTPLDFQTKKAIGKDIFSDHQQMVLAGGFDHNYVLKKNGNALSLAALVNEPKTGRIMEVWTTAPGLQFYSGNFFGKQYAGKGGKVYDNHNSFCLEPQHFPDACHHPNFPSVVLHPDVTYRQKTEFRFSID